jgi:hypothetical protein
LATGWARPTQGPPAANSCCTGLARNARAIAKSLDQIGGAEVLNEVVFTQVSVSLATTRRPESSRKR